MTLALSDGTAFQAPAPPPAARLQRKLSRARRGSNRRAGVRQQVARARARDADARKDWAEKTSTSIADVNAARNIAAGHAVTARGRSPLGGRMNREPQLGLLAS